MSVTATTLGVALKPVFEEIVKYAKDKGSAFTQNLASKSALKKICTKLAGLDRVRTVFAKEARISEFYVPAKFSQGKNETIRIEQASELYSNGPVLITGIAGQGKSIFLRHLAVSEASSGNVIPLFAELKRLGETNEKEQLLSFLVRTLERFGLPQDISLLEQLLDSGKGLLLLDAFDELPSGERARIANEIEDLLIKHPNSRVVISSRPDTEIAKSALLRSMSIAYLSAGDRDLLIKKIYGVNHKEISAALTTALKKNTRIAGILKTPLIVALLTITFSKDVKLPETLAAFYERVFEAMLVGHDSAKLMVRQRKSGLTDTPFRRVFESFCALSLQSNLTRFNSEKFTQQLETALKDSDLNPSLADAVLKDIVEITCLIVRDGDAYEYVHKTIQEYFSASFIRRLPANRAEKFYETVSHDMSTLHHWQNALTFLGEIDKYRYLRCYEIPCLERIFKHVKPMIELSGVDISREIFLKTYGDVRIHIQPESFKSGASFQGWGYSFPGLDNVIFNRFEFIQPVISATDASVIKHKQPDKVLAALSKIMASPNSNATEKIPQRILLSKILDELDAWPGFLSTITTDLRVQYSALKAAELTLRKEENQGGFLF